MNVEELTSLLGGWEGYVLGTVGRLEPDEEEGRTDEEIWLELLSRLCALMTFDLSPFPRR